MPSSSLPDYVFGPFRFRTVDDTLFRGEVLTPLRPRATAVLRVLLDRHGRVVTKDELLSLVWADKDVEEANVAQQIFEIRRVLSPEGAGESYIAAVTRRGYRFVEPVRLVEDPAPVLEPAARADTAEPPPPAPRLEPAVEPFGAPVFDPPTVRPSARPRPLLLVGLVATVLFVAVALTWHSRPLIALAPLRPVTTDRSWKGAGTLTDGQHIYFFDSGSWMVASIESSGASGAEILAWAHGYNLLDIDPVSGTFLATQGDPDGTPEPLWILDPSGAAAPVRVGSLQCETAAWRSADHAIACARGGQLWVEVADSAPRLSATVDGKIFYPRWAPDRDRIRFTVATAPEPGVASKQLWDVQQDGTRLHRVDTGLPATVSVGYGQWTTDGAIFVFQSEEDGRYRVWAIDESAVVLPFAHPQPTLLPDEPLELSFPVPIPSSHTVLAVGRTESGELVRYDVATKAFTTILPGTSGTWLSYAPDRRSIAFIGYPDGDLWSAAGDGSHPRRLTDTPSDGSSISPDGRWIAFRTARKNLPMRVFLIPTAGGQAFPVSTGTETQGIPSWSPDSQELAFGDVPRTFANGDPESSIYIYRLQDHSIRPLPGSRGHWTCRWSPDGRRLAALTTDKPQRLEIFDFDSNRWTALKAEHVDNPTWSHDGRYLYYDTEGVVRALRRVRVADDRVEDLADLSHFPLAAYWWSGLTPNDEPTVLRNLGSTEFYSMDLVGR